MIGRRTSLLALLAALAVLSQWLLRGTQPQEAPPPDAPRGYYLLDGTLRGVSEGGDRLFEISAGRVVQEPALARVALERVDVTWADRDALPWRLTAEAGYVGADWRQLELRGNVRIERMGGAADRIVLETDRLTVLLEDQRAATRSTVRVAGTHGVVLAEGMTADLLAQRFELEAQVRGRFTVPGSAAGERLP